MDRPTSSYGGNVRGSSLRNSRSPPRNEYRNGSGVREGSQGKRLSPLRSHVAAGMNSLQPADRGSAHADEEMYERRRQEELRR